jgi:hypothetical protein
MWLSYTYIDYRDLESMNVHRAGGHRTSVLSSDKLPSWATREFACLAP